MSYLFLSHLLTKDTPSYGNRDKVIIRTNSSIKSGETANSSCWIFSNNHIGTHMDVPKHFSSEGKNVCDYAADYFVFNKIELVDIPYEEAHLITSEDIAKHQISSEIEFLCIRTGFEKYRQENKYWNDNPGIHPDLPDYLRKQFPNLRCIGFDFISITSWKYRSEGRTSHKALLCPEENKKEILAIEDMSLEHLEQAPIELIIAPLLVEDGNGGAVSIIAKI